MAAYLTSYTTVLKDKPSKARPFRTAYIDAFAGTGYRSTRGRAEPSSSQSLLLPDLAESEPQELLDGSARIALKTQPRFARYIFIERRASRCKQLEALKGEFPHLGEDIWIQRGDANDQIQAICRKDWSSHRAVLFLDPYGMQVEWRTIEAIAKTRAIDLWILFPLGIAVNRLLTKSGRISPSWRHRLNLVFGTEDWYDRFYRTASRESLFGGSETHVAKAPPSVIGRYFVSRLKTVFSGVIDEPGVLRSPTNNPLYLLCFAVGNESGTDIAIRIANHLLKKLH